MSTLVFHETTSQRRYGDIEMDTEGDGVMIGRVLLFGIAFVALALCLI